MIGTADVMYPSLGAGCPAPSCWPRRSAPPLLCISSIFTSVKDVMFPPVCLSGRQRADAELLRTKLVEGWGKDKGRAAFSLSEFLITGFCFKRFLFTTKLRPFYQWWVPCLRLQSAGAAACQTEHKETRQAGTLLGLDSPGTDVQSDSSLYAVLFSSFHLSLSSRVLTFLSLSLTLVDLPQSF